MSDESNTGDFSPLHASDKPSENLSFLGTRMFSVKNWLYFTDRRKLCKDKSVWVKVGTPDEPHVSAVWFWSGTLSMDGCFWKKNDVPECYLPLVWVSDFAVCSVEKILSRTAINHLATKGHATRHQIFVAVITFEKIPICFKRASQGDISVRRLSKQLWVT